MKSSTQSLHRGTSPPSLRTAYFVILKHAYGLNFGLANFIAYNKHIHLSVESDTATIKLCQRYKVETYMFTNLMEDKK